MYSLGNRKFLREQIRSLAVIRMQPQNDATQTKYQAGIHERHIQLAHESTHSGPEIHDRLAVDGRWRFLLGRHPEIRLRKPGNWALHKTRNAATAFHRRLRRVPRNCWRAAHAFRLVDVADWDSTHCPDDLFSTESRAEVSS
jgi:hypothetical protein